MNASLDFADLRHALLAFTTVDALREAGVLLACLGGSWVVCTLLRRMLTVEGAVLFGRRTICLLYTSPSPRDS